MRLFEVTRAMTRPESGVVFRENTCDDIYFDDDYYSRMQNRSEYIYTCLYIHTKSRLSAAEREKKYVYQRESAAQSCRVTLTTATTYMPSSSD